MPVMGIVYLSGMYRGASWIALYPCGGMRILSTQVPV